jgi:hypothetical protein
MSNPNTIELPEDIRRDLVRAARESGTTPAKWIAAQLGNRSQSVRSRRPSAKVIDRANAALRGAIVDYGRTFGTDNVDIDRDLAAEYGTSHLG